MMKDFINTSKIKNFFFLFLFTLIGTSLLAQDKVSVKAEKVDDGLKITTIKNGRKSVTTYSMADAEKYLKDLGDEIDFDMEELGDNNYKFSYSKDGEATQTVEIDIDNMLENLSGTIEAFGDDIESLIENISSQIEYEETVDEDGNKVIKVKSIDIDEEE